MRQSIPTPLPTVQSILAPALAVTLALTLAMTLVAAPANAAEQRLTLDPGRSEVSFDLEATGHDVHGLVTLATGELTFDLDTGEAGGAIVLDAAQAVSGNSSRDRTMRDEVFEIARFPTIEFVPDRITGALAAEGRSQVSLHGVLRLHGEPHEMELPATVEVHGSHLTAEAKITIPYQEWGLHDPSVFFLRVARVVAVTVRADGELTAARLASGGPAR